MCNDTLLQPQHWLAGIINLSPYAHLSPQRQLPTQMNYLMSYINLRFNILPHNKNSSLTSQFGLQLLCYFCDILR